MPGKRLGDELPDHNILKGLRLHGGLLVLVKDPERKDRHT
jgi:hypothetical protein